MDRLKALWEIPMFKYGIYAVGFITASIIVFQLGQ